MTSESSTLLLLTTACVTKRRPAFVTDRQRQQRSDVLRGVKKQYRKQPGYYTERKARMGDWAALLEIRRRQQVMRRKREAMERITASCGDSAVKFSSHNNNVLSKQVHVPRRRVAIFFCRGTTPPAQCRAR